MLLDMHQLVHQQLVAGLRPRRIQPLLEPDVRSDGEGLRLDLLCGLIRLGVRVDARMPEVVTQGCVHAREQRAGER